MRLNKNTTFKKQTDLGIQAQQCFEITCCHNNVVWECIPVVYATSLHLDPAAWSLSYRLNDYSGWTDELVLISSALAFTFLLFN